MKKNMQEITLTDTGVSHDRHKHPARCTQDSDTTGTCVSQAPLIAVRICKCCNRQLPTSSFYMRDRLHTPDSYCKECRRAANRLRRKSRECPATAGADNPVRTVITGVQQREERLKLIMHALHTVHESIDRRREKLHQEELRKEWGNPCPASVNH